MHVVGQKAITEKCKPQCLAYCPTMDLVALATESKNLHVFRLNGQRVFEVSCEDEDYDISSLRWKPNGHLLAVACTDTRLRIISAFSGKTVHILHTLPQAIDAKITLQTWAINFTNSSTTQEQLEKAGRKVSIDDLLNLNADMPELLKAKADLPRELTLIDIESSLPKLSTLPATGGDDDVFSNRASIDAIFHAPNREAHNDCVDVLLTGFRGGQVHLQIFDCFEIGPILLDAPLDTPKVSKRKEREILCHSSHPLTSTHLLLARTGDGDLDVLSLDLNFIPLTAPHYLPTLAAKATQLQNLLRYLTQVHTQLAFEVKSAFDLPSKHLRNVNDTLAEHVSGTNFTTAAYHLVVTGECIPQLKEWLVDEVGERGLKRWEKSVMVGLETMRRLVHECLLPALERFEVVLLRLEGLSRFQKSAQVLGLDTKALLLVRDTADCMNLLAHDLLKVVGKELQEFGAFLKWIRLEAEVQGLERDSERAEELREGSDSIEYRTVLDYISGPLNGSAILNFIKPTGSSMSAPDDIWRASKDDSSFYRNFISIRKSNTSPDKMPKLDDLIRRLKGQCGIVFDHIADTLRKSVMSTRVCGLSAGPDPSLVDMRIVPNPQDASQMDIHILLQAPDNGSAVTHHKLIAERYGAGLVNARHVGSSLVHVTESGSVQDIKFIDDEEFMVLSQNESSACLDSWRVDTSFECHRRRHSFDVGAQARDRPVKMEINGRKGRRVVCVLDATGMQYTILDLDHQEVDQDGEDEAMTA